MILARSFGTIGERLEGRRNNFDLLRFVAASFVIVSHTLALLGFNIQPWIGNMTIGNMGVNIFFIISGFLITRSWESHPRTSAFLGKRILRIVPGLVGVTIFTAYVLGPIFTKLPLKQYLLSPDTQAYLFNSAIFPIHYTLPNVFWDNLAGGIVNGSIWTLPLEFLAYLGLLIAIYFGLLRTKLGLLAQAAIIVVVSSALIILIRNPETLLFGIKILWLIKYGAFFMMGAVYYIHRDRIVLSDWRALAVTAILVASTFMFGQFLVMLILLPYLIFYLAFLPNRHTENFGKYGDFSYGMYIYAWPVQQSIVALSGQKIGLLHMILIEFPAIIGLAAISWHLIEKPALKMKRVFNKERYPVIARPTPLPLLPRLKRSVVNFKDSVLGFGNFPNR